MAAQEMVSLRGDPALRERYLRAAKERLAERDRHAHERFDPAKSVVGKPLDTIRRN